MAQREKVHSQGLSDVRVLELGDFIAVPFCGKLLADAGAQVVKVESPSQGDRARRHGPFRPAAVDGESSGLFLYLNASKKGITLDVAAPEGRQVLTDLLPHFDVLLVSDYDGTARRQGWLRPRLLRTANPRMVLTCVTPYGLTGPRSTWKGRAITTTAAAGIAYRMGSPGRPPLTFPFSRGHYWAGMSAAAATMAALLARAHTGKGQLVDIAEAESMSTFMNGISTFEMIRSGRDRHRKGHRLDSDFAWTIMACKDGSMQLLTMQDRHWERFLEAMGNPPWAQNPRYRDRAAMGQEYPDEVEALLAPWFKERTRKEVWDVCRAARVPFHPVRTVAEVLACEHLAARDYFVDMPHPAGGTVRVPGPPYRTSQGARSAQHPAPRLGEHNGEVYGALLGYPQDRVVRLRQLGVI